MNRKTISEHRRGSPNSLIAWLLTIVLFAIAFIGVWVIAFSNSGKRGADPQAMDMVTTGFIVVSVLVGFVGATLSLLWRTKSRSIANAVLGVVALASLVALCGMWVATGGLSR